MTAAPETADAPACPPWCTEQHEPGVGGWDDSWSRAAGMFVKPCRCELPVIHGVAERVGLNRRACMDLTQRLIG